MKRYEFCAVRTGKQEAIIGFAYAAILMFPILAIRLGLFYLGLDKTLKSKSFILQFGFIFIVMAVVYASFYFIRKTQESLVKNYTVELDSGNIRIWEKGQEIMTGSVIDCEIINKMKMKPTAGVSVTIYTDTDKICFRLRGKEWKRLASAWSDPNPFGTSDTHDMETALTLCRDIKVIIGKSSNTDYGA